MKLTITERMMEKIFKGCNASELCDILEEEIGDPVAVSIASATILGHSQKFDTPFTDEYVNSVKYMSDEELKETHDSFKRFLRNGEPHVQAWPYLRHKQINCGCLFNDVFMGALLIPLLNKKAENEELNTVREAAKCFGIFLAASGYLTNRNSVPEQHFLIGLLNDDIDLKLHRKSIPSLAVNHLEKVRTLFILPKNNEPSFEHELAAICRRQKNWWHAPYKDGFAILIDGNSCKQLEKLREFLKSNQARACISDEFQDLCDIKKNTDKVHDVLEFCTFYGINDPLIPANDYKFILSLISSKLYISSNYYQNDRVEKMIEYDALHKTAYLDTLKAAFKTGRNYDSMAKSLHVHKNSVFYRMNRMKELFQLDLDDPIKCMSAFCAVLSRDGII